MVGGEAISFTHLEPFQFSVNTQLRPGGARIDVRFSNHCFSEAYQPTRHQGAVTDIWDRGQRRVFSPARYDLSLGLRAIIEALPSSPIYLTPEANFVRIMRAGSNGPDEYRVYVNARRGAAAHGCDVLLFVESDYAREAGKAMLGPAQLTKVRFALLVDKIIRGEKLRFHHKK